MFGKGSPDPWFDHDDVKRIAAEVLRFRRADLLKFVRVAVLSDVSGIVDAKFAMYLTRDPDYVEGARRVAAAGARIAASPQRDNMRGALITRITCDLVRGREPTADTEVTVKLQAGGFSKPKDVVTEGDPVEVYECKASAPLIDQADLDELEAIRGGLRHRGRKSLCCVVVLNSRTSIEAQFRQLKYKKPLYWASEDEILELGNVEPRQMAA